MSEWFLPQAERPWSVGNQVRAQVHGVDYFARLAEVISATDGGDEVYFTDWRGDADQLVAAGGQTVGQLLGGAARRGVQVRALLWRSHSDKTKFSAQENQELGAQINDAGGEALLDQRVRRGGSHHQKMVVVRHASRPEADVAFVGGIDLCHGRRDDATHAGDPQSIALDPRYGPRPPWHDAMLEIRGPAVSDVLATFVQRWNDPTPLDRRTPYRRLVHRKAGISAQPTRLPDPSGSRQRPVGTHHVQVLRTYPSKRPEFPFAPGGERTIARAYEHAFARAEQLIYVEDQYFWSAIVARTMAEALRRSPTLQVIAVVPRFPDQDGRVTGPPNRLGQLAAMELMAEAGGERFAIYDVENQAGTPVYVHAKLCIVDDEWLTCGSDNFNRRSWTHDSELTCAVVDPDRSLPRAVRRSLWSEHLGLPPADPRLDDLAGARALWRSRSAEVGCLAKPHRPEPVSQLTRLWAAPMYRALYDPDGRPPRLRRSGEF